MRDNPWQRIANADYERHMGHVSVDQLRVLSKITMDQMSLVRDVRRPVVAILGIANGNGLEHVIRNGYGSIIGIDINKMFLDVCRERYSHLVPMLSLHQIDLMTQQRRAVDLIKNADLVTANLLVEHIHIDNFVKIVRELERSTISVTIQQNPDGSLVSHSGYERAFDEVLELVQECDEGALVRSMRDAGYDLVDRTKYGLPNNKLFVRLDFRRVDDDYGAAARP